MGDLNGDGRPDVVTLNADQGTVSVFINKGDGTFRAPVQYATPGGAQRQSQSIALGNLRGNGKLDIVTANYSSHSISVLLNNGDGTFQPPVNSPTNGNPRGVAVGDFNGDGKLDIITANGGTGDVSVLLGHGDGTFEPPVNASYGHGSDARMVAVADFNHDGKLDAVVADGYPPGADGATISVLLGNGSGGFGPAQVINVGNTYQTPSVVNAADLNLDGSPDIVAVDTGCGYGGSDEVVLLGPTWGYRAGLGDSCVIGVAVGDINGDGIPDLVSVNSDSPFDNNAFVKVHLGKGDGTFQPPVVFPLSPAGGVSGVALADLNGDGKLDVVTANFDSADISVLLNTTPAPPTGGGPSPTENPAGSNPSARHDRASQGCACDPVNTAFGSFSESFVDFAIPGRGTPLGFGRTYSSVFATTDSPVGFGWTFSSAMSLTQDASTGTVTIHQENGSQVKFTLSGSTYSALPRVTATLVKNGDGTFTFVRNARDRFTFSATGRLTQEQDLNGYGTTFAYNAPGQLVSVTDPAKRTLTLAWSGTHISSVTDPIGRRVLFAYNDGQGNLTDVTDVNGGNEHFAYDANHLLLTMRDPRGGVVTTHYDSSNRVDWQTDQLNRKTTLAYTGDNLSTSGGATTITDPKGNVRIEQYQYGERQSVTSGSGTPQAATWKYTYDPATLGITSMTDPNNNVTTMTYDASGNVLTSTDALGRTQVSTYDALNNLLTTTDAIGVTTSMTYDGAGNLLGTSRPLTGSGQSATTAFAYGDPTHRGDVTGTTDADAQQTQLGYDVQGNLISVTDPLGNTARMQYDGIGRMTAQTSPRGGSTTFTFNAFGDRTGVTDALGHTSSSQYDANRNPVTRIDADGHPTVYQYDAANQTTAVVRADTTTLRTQYDLNGNVSAQFDGLGNATSYAYDALNRVATVTDPLNRTTSYGYDLLGNRMSLTDPQGQVTSFAYDVANQLTGIRYSDGKTPNVSFKYDADGRRVNMIDGTGTSIWAYDSLNRLTNSTNGAGSSVGYGHDLKGQVTSITYPGGQHVAHSYDVAGRLNGVTDWLGHTTTFGYDADSNLIAQTVPSSQPITDTFGYDAADWLMTIGYADSVTTLASFTYGRDAANLLTSEVPTGAVALASPELQADATPSIGIAQSPGAAQSAGEAGPTADRQAAELDGPVQIQAAIEASSNPVEVSATAAPVSSAAAAVPTCSPRPPVSVSTVLTNPDRLQVTVTATGSSVFLQQLQFGNPNSLTSAPVNALIDVGGQTGATGTFTVPLPGGTQQTAFIVRRATAGQAMTVPLIVVDSCGPWPTFLGAGLGTPPTPTPTATATVTATPTVTPTAAPTGPQNYSYTSLNQLQDVNGKSYTYNAADNLTRLASGATLAYDAANELTTFSAGSASTQFSYDARGNRTGKTAGGSTMTLGYDQANRLTAYGATDSYAYDGGGLRQSKTVAAVTTPFVWDAGSNLLKDGSTSYVYGPGGLPLEQVNASGNVLYFHHDQLGSTRAITDGVGVVQATYTYDPYGNTIATTGTVANPFKYAGGYTDAESGMQYLQARYYDPATAQFLTRDPMVAITRSPYSYVAGNPLNASDPSGLCSWYDAPCLAAEAAAAGANAAKGAWNATGGQVVNNVQNLATSSHTLGVCAAVSANLIVVGVTGEGCGVVRFQGFTPAGVASTETFGAGAGPGLGVTGLVGIQPTNAPDLKSLAGPFAYVGGSGGALAAGGGSLAEGVGSCGPFSVGFAGVGVGAGFTSQVGANYSFEQTWRGS